LRVYDDWSLWPDTFVGSHSYAQYLRRAGIGCYVKQWEKQTKYSCIDTWCHILIYLSTPNSCCLIKLDYAVCFQMMQALGILLAHIYRWYCNKCYPTVPT
jgi:hypothetical protein